MYETVKEPIQWKLFLKRTTLCVCISDMSRKENGGNDLKSYLYSMYSLRINIGGNNIIHTEKSEAQPISGVYHYSTTG